MDLSICLATILVMLLVSLYFYMGRNYNYWKNRGIPYLRPLPFFGNTLDIYRLKGSIGDVLEKAYKKFDTPFVGVFIHDRPGLLIRDLEVIKHVLVKDFHIFPDRTLGRNLKCDPIGAYMLFTLKSPEWRHLRKKVTPAFTTNRIKVMFKLIQESADRLSEYLRRYEDGSVLEARDIFAKYATDVITSIAFGIQSNCFNDEQDPFTTVARRIFNFKDFFRGFSTTLFFVSPVLAVKLLGLKFIDGESGKFLKDIFWQTVKRREKTKTTRSDVVDMLLQLKAKEKDDDPVKLEGDVLAGQVSQFFIAGFETVSNTITFTLFQLAVHPELQDILREEVMKIVEEYEEVTYDALKDMKYLEICIKETLRLYPFLPFLDRKCIEDYKVPGHDLVIENGTFVYISASGIHQNPEIYPEPEKYIPERFADDNNIPQFAWLPFGEGPRNCIGDRLAMVNVKSVIAKVICEYQLELPDPTKTKLILNPNGFLLCPLNSINLRFKRLRH